LRARPTSSFATARSSTRRSGASAARGPCTARAIWNDGSSRSSSPKVENLTRSGVRRPEAAHGGHAPR
jgi:hypothetical protein